MIDHLIFDTKDFETIEDSHSVGAFVRSGESGALITHHAPIEAGTISFDFVDGDVTVGTDSINETAHGLETGEVVQLTSSGTLPAGLALTTNYYVIRVDADNFKLADSAKKAEQGIAVDITAAAGGGTHTVTEQDRERRSLDVHVINPIAVNVDLTQADEITVFQGTSPWIIGDGGGSITVDAVNLDIRDLIHTQDSIAIGDGTDLLAINADGSLNITDNGGSLTVDAIDLDIRDLAHTQDSVRLGDGTNLLTSTTVGSDIGLDVYALNDPRIANVAVATNANQLGVADTAEDVVASPLANRKRLYIYNNGNKKIYLGETGVSENDGFPLSPGAYLDLAIGASIDLEWVGKDTDQQIRTLELS